MGKGDGGEEGGQNSQKAGRRLEISKTEQGGREGKGKEMKGRETRRQKSGGNEES